MGAGREVARKALSTLSSIPASSGQSARFDVVVAGAALADDAELGRARRHSCVADAGESEGGGVVGG
jgi:hypothetical protein